MSRRSRLIRKFARRYRRDVGSVRPLEWTVTQVMALDDIEDIAAIRFVRRVRRWGRG